MLPRVKELSKECKQTITKPLKAHGMQWIDHKYCTMERALENYGPYIPPLESIVTLIPRP